MEPHPSLFWEPYAQVRSGRNSRQRPYRSTIIVWFDVYNPCDSRGGLVLGRPVANALDAADHALSAPVIGWRI